MKDPKEFKTEDFVSADTGVTLSPGETIRTLRELNQMSQEQLAEETGIPHTTISSIENGKTSLGRNDNTPIPVSPPPYGAGRAAPSSPIHTV